MRGFAVLTACTLSTPALAADEGEMTSWIWGIGLTVVTVAILAFIGSRR